MTPVDVVEVSPPVVEPILYDDAVTWLRTDTDVTIETEQQVRTLIEAARRVYENYTRRRLIARRHVARFTGFARCLELHIAPVVSVEAVAYYATDGTLTTLDPAKWIVTYDAGVAEVRSKYPNIWPLTEIGNPRPVVVTFGAGESVPFTADDEGVCTSLLYMGQRESRLAERLVWAGEGGALPGGVSRGLYTTSSNGDRQFTLTALGASSPVSITDASSGWCLVGGVPANAYAAMQSLLGHWFENLPAVVTGTIATPIPYTVEMLMQQDQLPLL